MGPGHTDRSHDRDRSGGGGGSQGGALDANELKVALRVALGIDLSLSDVSVLVQVADKDGTESVDFDEFTAIVRRKL